MTTQPQSPSEQEIEQIIEGVVFAHTGYVIQGREENPPKPYEIEEAVGAIQALITQAADKREQVVKLDMAAKGYAQHWSSCTKGQHMGPECTCGLDAYFELRQGQAAEGTNQKPAD
jgi:hypothetical protein